MTPAELKNGILWTHIIDAAHKYNLDPELVGAIVMAESAGETWATRFEKHVYNTGSLISLKHQRPFICSADTDFALQACSFGLMQVMGFNARAQGFIGWLPELCRPEIGLDQGCKLLASLLKRWPAIEDSVSAYNQGSPRRGANGYYANLGYVNKVVGFYNDLKRIDAIKTLTKS